MPLDRLRTSLERFGHISYIRWAVHHDWVRGNGPTFLLFSPGAIPCACCCLPGHTALPPQVSALLYLPALRLIASGSYDEDTALIVGEVGKAHGCPPPALPFAWPVSSKL